MTFGHLLARAVARDVGRIMGFDEVTLNEISSLIPHKLGITLDEAYQIDDFKKFVHRNHRHQRWFSICKKFKVYQDIHLHMRQELLLMTIHYMNMPL